MVGEYKLCKWGHVRSPENVGTDGTCRECRKVRSHEFYIKNKERNKESYKKRYIRNKAHLKTLNSAWKKENKDKVGAMNQKAIANLSDAYVAGVMRVSVRSISPDIIQLKREQLLLKRANLELKNLLQGKRA